MDIDTICKNLTNTINGKEQLRAVYAKQLREGGDVGLISNIIVQFLDINLTELHNILDDVKKLKDADDRATTWRDVMQAAHKPPVAVVSDCTVSWRDVMQVKRMGFGWIADAAAAAKNLGYEYFLWNGRVYSTTEGDTGWLEEDLK